MTKWCDRYYALAALALLSIPPAAQAENNAQQPFTIDDLVRIEDVSQPVFAPDGERLVYVVESQGTSDARQSDLWSVSWAEGDAQLLLASPERSESTPEYSRDGQTLAFLRDGGEPDETQLWLIPASGGEPRQVSRLPGGVSDYSLSPDGRSAVVVAEVGAHVGSTAEVPPPIVVTRFQFKADGRDWLDDRRQQLFRIDLATGQTTQLTSGDFDNSQPSWSPDGSAIAFVSKRCDEADRHYCSDVYVLAPEGGEPRRISTFEGGDADPDFEAGGPRWSPDSQRLVWLQASDERLTWYAPFQLVVANIETGEIARPAWIDRWFYQPRWSADGRSILALVEQDRDTWLARIDVESGAIDYLTSGARFAYDFAIASNGRIAVLDGDAASPTALRSVEPEPRTLSTQNAWLAERTLGETRDIAFASGDTDIHGLLVLPPGHSAGQRHPLIVRLHGGPVYQFSHEFMADWQVYAAHGYAVLGINPRGSSGRGAAFAQAQMAAWGTVDVSDISAGIDHVIAMGVADPQAIGVGGWSYGGILTNYMIASDPRIRAAASGAGMGNFLGGYGADQYSRDYEFELGRPWENPDRWTTLSYPFFHADRITAPTLYLCAASDTNVPCIGSEQMYQALRSLDVPAQLVIYPGENHSLSVPSYIRDRMQRQLDWYDRWLRSGVDLAE